MQCENHRLNSLLVLLLIVAFGVNTFLLTVTLDRLSTTPKHVYQHVDKKVESVNHKLDLMSGKIESRSEK